MFVGDVLMRRCSSLCFNTQIVSVWLWLFIKPLAWKIVKKNFIFTTVFIYWQLALLLKSLRVAGERPHDWKDTQHFKKETVPHWCFYDGGGERWLSRCSSISHSSVWLRSGDCKGLKLTIHTLLNPHQMLCMRLCICCVSNLKGFVFHFMCDLYVEHVTSRFPAVLFSGRHCRLPSVRVSVSVTSHVRVNTCWEVLAADTHEIYSTWPWLRLCLIQSAAVLRAAPQALLHTRLPPATPTHTSPQAISLTVSN